MKIVKIIKRSKFNYGKVNTTVERRSRRKCLIEKSQKIK